MKSRIPDTAEQQIDFFTSFPPFSACQELGDGVVGNGIRRFVKQFLRGVSSLHRCGQSIDFRR
jgi:hypothetical protein